MTAGDGWTHCALGHRHWGLFGAAGLLPVYRAADGVWVLLQHRAQWSHHGGTWGVLGGARAPGETAERAAAREAWEEAGVVASAYTITGEFRDDHGGWSYVTVLARAEERFEVVELNAESTAVAWTRVDELGALPLHPGFAATWPAVQALI